LIILVLLKSEATTHCSKIYMWPRTSCKRNHCMAPALSFFYSSLSTTAQRREHVCMHACIAVQRFKNQLRAEEVRFAWNNIILGFRLIIPSSTCTYVCCAACLHAHVYSTLQASFACPCCIHFNRCLRGEWCRI
jgi:hypothetical protein